MKITLLLIILSFCIGCSPFNKQDTVIVIQPYEGFPNQEAKNILKEIHNIYPKVVLRSAIPFPQESYYKKRNRYRADILISLLKNTIGSDSVIVGLSSKDISTTKDGIKDWGVMGLGYRPGDACIVSTYRLSKNNKKEQFYKVVLHELGHTRGLPHCEVKTCFMRDAEGGNPLDEETGFCNDCKAYLQAHNWKLK